MDIKQSLFPQNQPEFLFFFPQNQPDFFFFFFFFNFKFSETLLNTNKNSAEVDIAPAFGEITTACNVGQTKNGSWCLLEE